MIKYLCLLVTLAIMIGLSAVAQTVHYPERGLLNVSHLKKEILNANQNDPYDICSHLRLSSTDQKLSVASYTYEIISYTGLYPLIQQKRVTFFDWDIRSKDFYDITLASNLYTSNIIYDASSVVVDEKVIQLDIGNTVVNRNNSTYAERVQLRPYAKYSARLVGAEISEKGDTIAGIVFIMNSAYATFHVEAIYNINLWDVKTGELLHSFLPDELSNCVHPIIEISFLYNDRYLMTRLFYGGRFALNIFDIENKKRLPAICDIDFSSDGKYYVTERDSKPSLVLTETNEVVGTFNTGSLMRACCFSPDNSKLYIACRNLQIYEFDNPLSVTVVRDWELF